MAIHGKLPLICCVSVSILTLTGSVLAQNNKFIDYYSITNLAELKVVDSLYADALITYESGFKLVPFPFAHDYYNAAVCAVLVRTLINPSTFLIN